MKISLNSQFLSGPYGGGMQFANFMRRFLEQKGVTVVNHLRDPDIDIILHVNPFPRLTPQASAYSFEDAFAYKKRHPGTVIVERVNECDERKGTSYMNSLLVKASQKSDFVVFIASWLRPLLLAKGLSEKKPFRVILNGADESVFNTKGKDFWNGQGRLKIVTHHWSDNLRKGHRFYQKLDILLQDRAFNDKFEFTYIGRVPEGLAYVNSRVIPPLSGKELAAELKKHHVYLTATENEPAGMHHIEGALCGLPLLYLASGALPEYCEGYGLPFDEGDFATKLDMIRENYSHYAQKILGYGNTAEKMGEAYWSLLSDLYAKREAPAHVSLSAINWRGLLPRFLKYPLIALYVFIRCLLRGSPTQSIAMNLAGVLPKRRDAIVHGGKVKLLHVRERFGDTWKGFNLAYFASSGLPFAPAVWLRLYRLFGIKTVWNQNGFAYPALYPQKVAKKINSLMRPMFLADYVVFQTEFTRRCAEKFLRKLPRSSAVIINPVDTEKYAPRETPLPLEPLVVIMSGNHFESRERLDISLEALKKIRDSRPLKLIVIGRPDFEIKEEWVEHTGAFTQEKAPALYRQAHLLLHLKYLDPCPTIVLEALASGLPVVGQGNGGMPELVDGESGVLLPVPEDFDRLCYPEAGVVAQAILQIASELQRYSAAARMRAVKFDKQIWLSKHESIFRKLLS